MSTLTELQQATKNAFDITSRGVRLRSAAFIVGSHLEAALVDYMPVLLDTCSLLKGEYLAVIDYVVEVVQLDIVRSYNLGSSPIMPTLYVPGGKPS